VKRLMVSTIDSISFPPLDTRRHEKLVALDNLGDK